MRKIFLAAFLAVVTPAAAWAGCVGTGTFYSCIDASGNSYTVSKLGGTTTVNGSNASTGSQWNQTSNTFGHTTFTNGATNGRTWNETQQSYGNGNRSIYGTNSQGQGYNHTCTAYGCN